MSSIAEEKVVKYLDDSKGLFEKWKNKDLHTGALFIEDGVVNPEIYFNEEERIVFLLKEAYAKTQDNLSLTEWLDDETEKITTIWRRVSEWTRIINDYLSGKNELVLFKQGRDIAFNGNEFLKKIAVVNVKKSNGNPSSESQELFDYAQKDKEELLNQIKLCDPTILVCGNVENCLREIVEQTGEELSIIDKEHSIYRFKLNGHDVLVISYWHPANRYPNVMNYYGFIGVCKVAFAKK